MSGFLPVELPAGRGLGARASQTFLRHYNGCPRSAFFYQAHKGGVRTVEMMRGSALHAVLERGTRLMVEENEPSVPPEMLKVIVNEVLAEFAVPFEEHDYIREMAFRWAEEWTVDPEKVIAIETLVALEVDGWQLRSKIDFAEMLDGHGVKVVDYKSAKGAPTYDEVSRRVKRDGRLAAKSFQLILYALSLAFGHQVRIEQCWVCGGAGRFGDVESACPDCGGDGRLERIEPFPLAAHAEMFDLQYVFPGIEDSEGRMLRRVLTLSRAELAEYRESMVALVRRVRGSEESGDWPAVLSDAACAECPASSLCPIPVELRDHRGRINTLEEAVESAAVLDRRAAIDAAIRRELKAFAKAHGLSIPLGDDREWVFVVSEKREIRDRDGMTRAIREAVELGKPFDMDQWQKRSQGTNFVVRKVIDDGSEDE